MLRIVLVSGLLSMATGCSIVQPHPDAIDTLRATRTLGGVTIENQSRWTLPPFAAVTVAHADGRIDNERLLAVQTGLAEHLQISAVESNWRLVVHWPDMAFDGETAASAADQHWAVHALRTTGNMVTRTADRDELVVDVIHSPDNSLVTRLTVAIEPWLRGRDWHDPVALTRAFSAVGAALTGT